MPFGLKTAGRAFGQAFDASLELLSRSLDIDYIAQWGDDVLPFRYPVKDSDVEAESSAAFRVSLEQILDGLRSFGWPLAPEKTKDFSTLVSYCGFDWDLSNKRVALPDSKRITYLNMVTQWLENACEVGVSMRETSKLVGTLVTATFVFLLGRGYLQQTRLFVAKFAAGDKSPRSPPRACVEEVEVWEQILFGSLIPSYRTFQKPPAFELQIQTSTSEHSITIVVGDKWRRWNLASGWQNTEAVRDELWAESVAIEMAIHHIVHSGLSDMTITIRTTSFPSVSQFRKGWSRSVATNDCIRRVASLSAKRTIEVEFEVIKSADGIQTSPTLSQDGPLDEGQRLDKVFHPTHLEEWLLEI